MKNDNHTPRYVNVPLLIAFALVLGIFIGSKFASKSTIDLDRKINNILGIVAAGCPAPEDPSPARARAAP